MDYVGSLDGTEFEGGEGRGQVVELGSGRLIPGFEEQLEGAKAGETRGNLAVGGRGVAQPKWRGGRRFQSSRGRATAGRRWQRVTGVRPRII